MSPTRSALLQLVLVAGLVGLAIAPAVSAAATLPADGGSERLSRSCGIGTDGTVDDATRSANLTVQTLVAPGDRYDRLTSPAALRAARANGTLTPASVGVDRTWEDDVVAYRDVAVHRVTLSGNATTLADRLEAANGTSPTERFRSLLDDGSVEFAYLGPTACPPDLAVNASFDAGAIRVVPDPVNDTVAFVLDLDRLRFHPLGGGEPTTDTRVLGHHSFELGLPAGGLVGSAVAVGTGYQVERGAAELVGRHDGLVRVDPAADQILRGRTRLAPGSTVAVRLVPYTRADSVVSARGTVDRSREFAVSVDLGSVPDGAIYVVGFESITEPPVVNAGGTFVAVGNATGAIVDLRSQNTTGGILYGPVLTTTHGGFVTVRNASGGLVGVSEYREPGAAVAQIDLAPVLSTDQRVTVTVYRDANGNRAFDEADVPYRVNGSPVRDTAMVRLEGQPRTTTAPPPVITYSTATATEPSPASPTSTPGQPGFGVLTALVGGLVALGLRVRI